MLPVVPGTAWQQTPRLVLNAKEFSCGEIEIAGRVKIDLVKNGGPGLDPKWCAGRRRRGGRGKGASG